MRTAIIKAFVPPTWPERAFYFVFCAMLVMGLWQAFDRTPPAEVLERTLVTEQVRPGGMLVVRNKMVRHRSDSEISLYRILYDGYNLRFEYGVQTLPVGSLPIGEEIYLSQVPISNVASPGQARMEVTACWARQFNVIHQFWPVCRPLKTINFTITTP